MNSLITEIAYPEAESANIVYESIMPEKDSSVKIELEHNILRINIDCENITRLRAVFNSYMRWFISINKIKGVLKK